MSEWEGWSSDQRQVDLTRVLAVLFASLGADGQTRKSTGDVAAELQLADVDATDVAVRLVEMGLFRADSLSMAPAQDTLLVTPQGRRVEAEFRQATTVRRVVGPQARRALLLWRFDFDGDRPHSSEMLTAAHAWFYGGRFSDEAIAAAADNLVERGYLEAMKQTMGRVGRRIQLTAAGTACVERFDGDPDAMDTALQSGQSVTIASYLQQGGNNAFGSTVGSQHTEGGPVIIGHPAADLAVVLQIVTAAGDIPEEFADASAETQVALRIAAADGSDPRPLIERTGRLIESLAVGTVNPSALALLTAGVGYAGRRAAAATVTG